MIQTPYGLLGDHLESKRLSELCEERGGIQTGPFGSQLHNRDYVSDGTPILTVEHLGENRIIHADLPRVTAADKVRLAKYTLRKGDIVFSRVGSVDRRALVRSEENGWLFSGRCLRVRPKQNLISPEFLSYFFGLTGFMEHIRRIAVGATMPSLNTQLLADVPIYYPPLIVQRAIANILGTLDDKIELNRQTNQTLKDMAQALFKSWFVDFGPFREQGMQDSSLGEVPVGWEVKKVGQVLELKYGKGLKEEDRNPGNIPVYGSNGRVGWHDESLVKGPGVIVGRKGNPGTLTWAPTDFFPIDTTFYVEPTGPSQNLAYLFHALQSLDLPSLGADSAVPGLNRNMAYMSNILVPPATAIADFDRYTEPLMIKVYANDKECQTLGAVRDALLPKLLSGEIRVKEAEKFVEKVV